MDTVWIATIGAVVLGAVYWFFFRDDNGFPEGEPIVLNIKPVTSGGLSSSKNKPVATKKLDGKPIKILFYTQTGTAEDFARRLGDDMINYGFAPDVLEVDGFDGDSLADEKLVIFFASTYGEGDPPDNAIEFHEWLMDESRDSNIFSGLKFAVFGLGNKTYPEYNVMGKQIDKRMAELGATRIFDLGLGNDDENIEDDFLVWKKGFAPVVCKEFGMAPPGDISQSKINFKQRIVYHASDDVKLRSFTAEELDAIPRWRKPKRPQSVADRNTPFLASIVTRRELHKEGSDRSCLHVEVSTHKDVLQYHAGDHIGIYPENEDALVDSLATLLKVDSKAIVSIYDNNNNSRPLIGPCTIRALLKQYFDIAFYPKKPLLRVLAQFAKDQQERDALFKLSSDEPGNMEYENFIVKSHRTIHEVLEKFPSVEMPVEHFFEHLPKLQPRYYSISSSPNKHPDTVHITAVVSNWVTPTGRKANGVATTWLATRKMHNPVVVPAFIRKSNFKLPPSVATPTIMVGPGTGLAPFRGFLQELDHRRATNKGVVPGDVILFFGCRNHHDYLYEDELTAYHKAGVITDLQVAFSRESNKKVYVQHLMKQNDMPKKIWDIISSGGYFYICGDAKLMARDVTDAMTNIISQHGNMSVKDAEKYLEKLLADGRHQQDVWS